MRLKVMIGVLLPLAGVLAAFACVQYIAHERMVYGITMRTASELGAIVESSLAGAMMSGERTAIQSTVDHLAANTEVDNLFLLDSDGAVRVSPEGDTGHQLSKASDGCRDCHQTGNPEQQGVVLDVAGIGPAMRNCRPIVNHPECHACHAPEAEYNGILITDLSLENVHAHLADYRRLTWFSLIGAIGLGGVMLGASMNRAVVSPLAKLTTTARSLGAGNLTARSDVTSDDELGELSSALDQTAQVMQDRERLGNELHDRTDELERVNAALLEKEAARALLIQRIINAQEGERRRIARHLHDELAQSLTGLVMSIDAAEGVLDEHAPEASDSLRRTREVAAQGLDQTRQLILDLRPSMLDDLGLVSAIRWYADEHLGRTGVVVVFASTGQAVRLPSTVETALFRIAQEAMNNIARHARANSVRIDMSWSPDAVDLFVADDGRGFDADGVSDRHDSGAGLGLLGMKERADMLGGVLDITSAQGEGTRVAFVLPIDKPSEDE